MREKQKQQTNNDSRFVCLFVAGKLYSMIYSKMCIFDDLYNLIEGTTSSIMDVVSTVELNRIGARNMLNLDLNAVMVEIISVAEYLVRLLKHSWLLSVLIGVQNYVASER